MNSRDQRPVGITLLALPLIGIGCLGALSFPVMIFGGGVDLARNLLTSAVLHSRTPSLIGSMLFTVAWLGLYVLCGFVGVGLWKLRGWARTGAVAVQLMGIAVGLVAVAIMVLQHQIAWALPSTAGVIAPFTGVLWYLNQPTVRSAFHSEPLQPEGVPTLLAPAVAPSNGLKPWMAVTVTTVAVACMTVFAGALL